MALSILFNFISHASLTVPDIQLTLYNLLNELGTAIEYARYIIKNSNNPNYRSNAYYHLINYAKFNDDLELISLCSCAREDEDRILRQSAELRAQATIKLRTYLDETNYTNKNNLFHSNLQSQLPHLSAFYFQQKLKPLQTETKIQRDNEDFSIHENR